VSRFIRVLSYVLFVVGVPIGIVVAGIGSGVVAGMGLASKAFRAENGPPAA